MAFAQQHTRVTSTSSFADQAAKPLAGGLIIAGACSILGGYNIQDALKAGAVGAGSVWMGEMGAGYVFPQFSHLRGTAKVLSQRLVESTVTGAMYSMVKPSIVARPYRVFGLSPMASDFALGFGADMGANVAHDSVRAILG